MFGIIGSGSWATALAKILTDNQHSVNWWIRDAAVIRQIQEHGHNPRYLSSVTFDRSRLAMSDNIRTVQEKSDVLLAAVPSAYAIKATAELTAADWKGKKMISAIKGLLPGKNILFNEYMQEEFSLPPENYFAVLGPCHAEEVAAEKLSYLTFSGTSLTDTMHLASFFSNRYIHTRVNQDIFGVQYAAVLKNIYALGAGIAHGLEYGDNFLSVYIANAADEMACFLKKAGIAHITVGEHSGEDPVTHRKMPNYAASVYLGDLLVTCYSLYSRNRTFGNMIGKGYSVQAAQLEMNMIAEGYHAAKCINSINNRVGAQVPMARIIYEILWKELPPAPGFKRMEQLLV